MINRHRYTLFIEGGEKGPMKSRNINWKGCAFETSIVISFVRNVGLGTIACKQIEHAWG